jgi:hypothetical protein
MKRPEQFRFRFIKQAFRADPCVDQVEVSDYRSQLNRGKSMIRLIALGLIVAAYAATCFVSPYGFWMKDSPRVAVVAELPDSAIPPDIDQQLRFQAIQVPADRPDLPFSASRVQLGWSYRIFEALKLPFHTYTDYGYVLYAESRNVLQIIPLDDAALARLNAAAGRDLTAGYAFPGWHYLWGWLFVAALAVWLAFQFRHEAVMRKRELESELEE